MSKYDTSQSYQYAEVPQWNTSSTLSGYTTNSDAGYPDNARGSNTYNYYEYPANSDAGYFDDTTGNTDRYPATSSYASPSYPETKQGRGESPERKNRGRSRLQPTSRSRSQSPLPIELVKKMEVAQRILAKMVENGEIPEYKIGYPTWIHDPPEPPSMDSLSLEPERSQKRTPPMAPMAPTNIVIESHKKAPEPKL